MIRLPLLGSAVAIGLAAWLGADDGSAGPGPAVVEAETAVVELAVMQPDRPARPADFPDTLSNSMIGRCMEVAREVDPELAERLDTIRRDRSEADFRRAIGRARHLVGLARLKQENPPLYDVKVKELRLQARVDRVMGQIIDARRSSSPSAEGLQRELEVLVRQQVGYTIIARGFYLRSLIDHVEALREELNRDILNHEPAVQRRLRELLDRVDAAVDAD